MLVLLRIPGVSLNFKYGTGGSKGVCELIKASESTKENKKLIYQPGNTFTMILKVSIGELQQ